MKNRLLIFFIFILSLITQACNGTGNNHFSDSSAPDTLKVVTIYGPTSYFDFRGEPLGIDYENVRRFAQEEGYEFEIKTCANIPDLINALKSGEADLAAYPVPIIAEYSDQLIYCGAREITNQVLVQRKKNNHIEDVTELIGEEIYAESNSKYLYRLQNLNQELGGGINIVEIKSDTITSDDMIEMVNSGKIDFTVVDSDIASLNSADYPELDMTVKISLDQAASWAVAKDHLKLAEKIDNWEKKNHDSPIVKEIYKKYYDRGKDGINPGDFSYFTKRKLKKGDAVSAYDDIFKKYAETAGYDWEMLAAIAYCESGYNQSALSRFGAKGLMQVMPVGASSVGIDPELISSPDYNVLAAARIINMLNRSLRDKVEDPHERIKFILAAYNSGLGHIYDSMALAEKNGLDPSKWTGNVSVAVLMKSRPEYYTDPVVRHGYFRGRETVDFVDKVTVIYNYLKDLN